MNEMYPFQCRECETEVLLTLEQANSKVVCESCTDYIQQFKGYLIDFEDEINVSDDQNHKIGRLVNYVIAMNEYAENLNIEIDKNTRYFEKLIEIASGDKERKYNFLRLKYDTYVRVTDVLNREQILRREQDTRQREIFISRDYSYTLPDRTPKSSTEVTYAKINSLIKGNPEEYKDYIEITPIQTEIVPDNVVDGEHLKADANYIHNESPLNLRMAFHHG